MGIMRKFMIAKRFKFTFDTSGWTQQIKAWKS